MEPGETAQMEMTIGSLTNPSGKYEPTSGDEGDGQWIEINKGAQATGYCFLGELRCWTTDINLWVEDDGVEENKIGRIITELPINTPWGVDFY